MSVVSHLETCPVVPGLCELCNLTFLASHIHITAAVPNTQEIELRVCALHTFHFSLSTIHFSWCPAERFHITPPIEITLRTIFQRIDTQAVEVSLIAVTSHRLPCYIFSVWRELRILVVAGILHSRILVYSLIGLGVRGITLRSNIAFGLAEIPGLTCTYIIQIDIRVGRCRIVDTHLFATGVCDSL